MNIWSIDTGDTLMLRRTILTGTVELLAFGTLLAALAAWAVALAPVR